ncbi:SDR family oxidoreductase [Xanthomonas translucens]|uniref:SDR family oxidoreductase n=1 Tax=Xanthomonas campestris pv. translucens TaxID=343 RepID=UPI00071E90C7|nr:SDR family oxidoreductase [Xanthomonas translucens]KTF41136.1 dehydrogenase [Xanthomonas translucens pv. translucens]MCT8274764.1 SDR family oxidoreductase [Xanthomonas translucens pv. translucens]MCT8278484.1 SDR family oxidoreductase [Xanthomonas translucens pv. translucens]MCT8307682.1 SDR family oxidoreductase [Xanthomonas translucens pv. translucens]UII63665.1 SDR family oxidoreductase [Xanthomonas translucens]
MPVPNYPSPPFKPQQQSFPGLTDKMDPKPDHGEDSYVGHGLLQGKRTLITGGDSGIGAAVAIAYAREGADVAIAYLPSEQHDAARIGQLLETAGVRVLLQPCDISDRAQAQALIETVSGAFGGLDVLVNNAAYQRYFHSFDEITLDEWEKTFATNVHAVFHLVQLAVPHMPEGSSIINTASVNSKKPTPNILPYSTTKGAVANMTIGLAGLLADKKIRVNAVLPGPIWTPFIPAGMDEDSVKEFGTQTPFGRPGQPAELASAYVLLAADTSSYTSGALLTIAGGAATL